jgi:hypothetical protein
MISGKSFTKKLQDAGEGEVVADNDGNNDDIQQGEVVAQDAAVQGDENDASSANEAEVENEGEEDIHEVASNLKRRRTYAYSPSRRARL